MQNKEVSKILQNYFMNQTHEKLSKACALLFIDLNRFLNINNIPKREADFLVKRTRLNIDALQSILNGEDVPDLKFVIENSEETSEAK